MPSSHYCSKKLKRTDEQKNPEKNCDTVKDRSNIHSTNQISVAFSSYRYLYGDYIKYAYKSDLLYSIALLSYVVIYCYCYNK